MSDTKTVNTTKKSRIGSRYAFIAVVVVAAFFGAFQFASAKTAEKGAPVASGAAAFLGGAAAGDAAGGAGCACCGSTAPTEGGVTGDIAEGAASVGDGVQTLSVDLSKGYYQPNVLKLKAGVPAEITFGQSSGCTGQVMSEKLGFFEDLSTGAKTVKLGALEPGEYEFSCGMKMVFGKIVVE